MPSSHDREQTGLTSRPTAAQFIQHPSVAHVRWDWPARQRLRRVVRRRQVDRAEAHVHKADAQLLGHRPCAGRGRHQAGRHQRITSLGRRRELVELLGDQFGYEPRHVGRRRRCRPVQQRAHGLADRHQRHADLGQPLREVRRRAHPHLPAQCPQLHSECHERFDVPAPSIRRQQHTHCAVPIFFRRLLARPAILGHDPGLAASPRCPLRMARSGRALSPSSGGPGPRCERMHPSAIPDSWGKFPDGGEKWPVTTGAASPRSPGRTGGGSPRAPMDPARPGSRSTARARPRSTPTAPPGRTGSATAPDADPRWRSRA